MRDVFKKLAMAAMAAMIINACQKDKNNDDNMAKNVSGTYSGYSKSDFQYSPDPIYTDGESVTVTELSETSVSVIFESETWGKLVIPEATVSETDGGYGITGEGSAIMGMGDKTGEYPCTLKATINRNRDFSFEYSIPSVMGGLTVTIMSGNIPSKVMPVKLDTYENPHEYV